MEACWRTAHVTRMFMNLHVAFMCTALGMVAW